MDVDASGIGVEACEMHVCDSVCGVCVCVCVEACEMDARGHVAAHTAPVQHKSYTHTHD